jgi:hypothetical protein
VIGDASTEELDARADRSALIVASVIFGPLTIGNLALYMRGRDGTGGLIFGVVWAFACAYVLTYRVTISSGQLTIRTLFSRVVIPLAEIAHARVLNEIGRGRQRLLPPNRLEISQVRTDKLAIINLKMLRRDDINRLLAILQAYTRVTGVRKF